MFIQANACVDGYKLGHIEQYVVKTRLVYAHHMLRSNRLANFGPRFDGKAPFVGLQLALMNMVHIWKTTFFDLPKEEVVADYTYLVKNYLGDSHGDVQIEAMSRLHDLGYLPLEVKALPEGSLINMGIPPYVVRNTHDEFYWLTNYCETYLSSVVWTMVDACAVQRQYHDCAKHYAKITGADDFWVKIACHNFAARGHRGPEDAMISGVAASMWSYGSDTLSAIPALRKYYGAEPHKEIVLLSVNATEHATATQRIAYYREVLGFKGRQAEIESLRDLLIRVYPKGILSYVGDSENLWELLEQLYQLWDVIKSRKADSNGLCKLVIRPDSSLKTPLQVICGWKWEERVKGVSNYYDWWQNGVEVVKEGGKFYEIDWDEVNGPDDISWKRGREMSESEVVGVLEMLARLGGTTTNAEGFRMLHPMLGLIYGEGINYLLQEKIYQRMVEQGWCVSNLLLGVGSWGFLGNSSRDRFSQAIKGSFSIVDDIEINMSKNPITDSGSKKSPPGLLRVSKAADGNFVLHSAQTWEQEAEGELARVFMNGDFYNLQTQPQIRQRFWEYVNGN